MEIGVDGCKDNCYEYTTLACQLGSSLDVVVTVHLKVLFSNVYNQQAVLKVYALIAGEANAEINGVYYGCVNKEQAIATSRDLEKNTSSMAEEDIKLVHDWLNNARLALTEQHVDSNNDNNTSNNITEYVYRLQFNQNENDQKTLRLCWKIKLRPFGMMTLGSICLSKITMPSEFAQQVSSLFVQPLISSLLEEKNCHEQMVRAASKNENQLLDDNKRLLNQMQSMTDFQQKENKKLVAQFLKVLNTKKLRLAEVQEELSRLKKQQEDNVLEPTTKTEEKELLNVSKRKKGRNSRSCNVLKTTKFKTKIKDEQFDANSMTLKKQKIDYVNMYSKEKPMEIDCESSTSTTVTENNATVLSTTKNCGVNDLFEADTQIDSENLSVDEPEDPSPPWLQQQLPSTQQTIVSPYRLQTSQIKNNDSPNKSVLDNLWSGIF